MECPGSGTTYSHQLLLSARLTGATSATGEDIDPRGRHHTRACYDGDVHSTITTHHHQTQSNKLHHTSTLSSPFISAEQIISPPLLFILPPQDITTAQSQLHIHMVIACQQIRLGLVIIAH